MAFAPRIITGLVLSALLVPLAERSLAAEGESTPAVPQPAASTAAEPTFSWQGPAAAAAEAAATQAAKEAIVPPLPQPAQRPTEKKTEPAAEAPAAKDAAPAKAESSPAKPDSKDAKGKDADKKKTALTAKQLFGTVKSPAPLKARAVGFYSRGCLAGGKPIPVDGPGWQVMRLSRNRNWGHPELVALIERLARESTQNKEWPGLLVGDMSQPRGGPMISGHASHQVGLDADIWLTPMPDRKLTRREREDMSAVSMLKNAGEVDPKVWGEGQFKLIKRAASYSKVERILVHPALKKALCEAEKKDKSWLSKVRPYFGHYYHFHLRIGCPSGSGNCRSQPPVPGDDGCGAELTDWLKRVAPKPRKPPTEAKKPTQPSKPAKPKPEITLADLPADCRTVLTAGGNVPPTEAKTLVDKSKDAGPERDVTVNTAAPVPDTKAEPVKATTAN
jgi:penicillin-insensitive murein endopeptidase